MSLLNALLLVGLFIVSWHLSTWMTGQFERPSRAPGRFMPVAPPSGMDSSRVVVWGPTCDGPEGEKTRALMAELDRLGVPYTHTTTVLEFATAAPGEIRGHDVLKLGDPPLVFINGKVKATPTAEETLAQYRAMVEAMADAQAES